MKLLQMHETLTEDVLYIGVLCFLQGETGQD